MNIQRGPPLDSYRSRPFDVVLLITETPSNDFMALSGLRNIALKHVQNCPRAATPCLSEIKVSVEKEIGRGRHLASQFSFDSQGPQVESGHWGFFLPVILPFKCLMNGLTSRRVAALIHPSTQSTRS